MAVPCILISLLLAFAHATTSSSTPLDRRHHHAGSSLSSSHTTIHTHPLKKSKAAADEVSMGTTLVAICCKGGVVVGADTRTSVSDYVSNRYAYKLTPISENVVVCRSGSAADTQRLCDEATWEIQSRRRYSSIMSVSQVAHLLRFYMRDEEQDSPLEASLLCAGVDSDGVGRLYSILPNGTLLQHGNYAVSGSGSTYIMGYLDHFVNDSNNLLEEEQAIELVKEAIQLAMNRDGSSGGLIRLYSLASKKRKSITIYPSSSFDHEGENGATDSSAHTTLRNLPGFADASSTVKP